MNHLLILAIQKRKGNSDKQEHEKFADYAPADGKRHHG